MAEIAATTAITLGRRVLRGLLADAIGRDYSAGARSSPVLASQIYVARIKP
jgi:hypothetical protein